MDLDVVYACKAIYAEAWPILLYTTQLNMTYRGEAPSHRGEGPPWALRQRVREIWFHQKCYAKRPRKLEQPKYTNTV